LGEAPPPDRSSASVEETESQAHGARRSPAGAQGGVLNERGERWETHDVAASVGVLLIYEGWWRRS
jgi:hypothetical protein